MSETPIIDSLPTTIAVELNEGVATVTLNRPEVLNAVNQPQRQALERVFRTLEADERVRAVVLRGAGRAFCAGQDQKESARMNATEAAQRIEAYAALYDTMRALGKPLIASMHGYAAGAGLQLALLADLRIAARGTRMGMTELNVSSAAILGSTMLQAVVGEAAMKQLVLMAEFVPAERALAVGLVHEVVDDGELDARVQALAADLAAKPPMGIRLTKVWWREMSENAFQASVAHARTAHAHNFEHGGLSEGARRFVGKKAG